MTDRIARRYAKALYEIAQFHNMIETYDQQLRECIQVLKEDSQIGEFIRNPENSSSAKHNLIERLLEQKVKKEVIQFLKLLIDKNRMDLLAEIQSAYSEEVQQHTKSLTVRVITAFPLQQKEKEKIRNKLQEKYHVSRVELEIEVERGLIGGIKLIVGNEIIDKSYKGAIESLKNHMMGRSGT